MSPTERRSVSQGETARRIVVSGVKAIGNIGMTYWNARSQPQVYSRSAPGSSPSDLRAQAAPRHAGYVRVIDLKTEKTSAHFRPTESSVAVLSFDPSGTMLLTGSSESRAFHVFELRGAEQGRLWHRFDLSRGMTSARAEAASWSEDGRFVSISTARGTARASPPVSYVVGSLLSSHRRLCCLSNRRNASSRRSLHDATEERR